MLDVGAPYYDTYEPGDERYTAPEPSNRSSMPSYFSGSACPVERTCPTDRNGVTR